MRVVWDHGPSDMGYAEQVMLVISASDVDETWTTASPRGRVVDRAERSSILSSCRNPRSRRGFAQRAREDSNPQPPDP